MTDDELVASVLGVFDPGAHAMCGLMRGGRLLLSLPTKREAAGRALRLYQPQRRLARSVAALLNACARVGLHGWLLSRLAIRGEATAVSPRLAGIEGGTCGVLLGSPEHKVRRAIASYRSGGAWEVAKIAFGAAGAKVLEEEARVLAELRPVAAGVPELLGLHHGIDVTMLRMPYLTGTPVAVGESVAAIRLLNQWRTDRPPQLLTAFPEWAAIQSALSASAAGQRRLAQLAGEVLRPVICHGDFARWNLLQQAADTMVVLDWEWGQVAGLPGLDLVHYFLQDFRLVSRLQPSAAIARTLGVLKSTACRDYLAATGWSCDPLLLVIVSLAYKHGAGQQDNQEILEAALACV